MRRFLSVLAGGAMFLLSCVAGVAQNTSKQESRKAALQKEIAQLEQQLKENSSKSSNALNSLTLVRKQIDSRKALLAESRREIDSLDREISAVRVQAKKLQARLDSMMFYHRRLVRNAYKNRDARLWYLHLFASRDLGQAVRRYSYLRNLSGKMSERAVKMKEVKAQLDTQMAHLTVLKGQSEKLLAQREKDMEKLRLEEKNADKLISRLRQDKNFYQRQLSTKRRQVEALNKEIEKIIAQAMKEASSSGSGKSKGKAAAPVDYKLAESFAANKGKLPWPAQGPVVEKFGKHNHPVYTKLAMPFNNGINIGVARNTGVEVVFDGEVKRVIVMPGYNKCVLVQHGNYFTFYCKLADVVVKAGDKLKTGDIIGTVDSIDGQTQLHFQVWKEKTPQNPELWLRPR